MARSYDTSRFRLSHLLGEKKAADFLRRHWPSQFCFLPQTSHSVRALREHPYLFRLDDFLERYEGGVSVWERPTRANPSPKLEEAVPAKFAKLFYRAGATLYFVRVETFFPELAAICRSLEKELELPEESCRMEFFASPAGSGTVPHFDHEINLNFQLAGRKQWAIAENRKVPNPLSHYKAGGKVGRELGSYAPRSALKMPRASRKFLARPGSFVFLPQGTWHTTRALDDSLALTIAFVPPCWLDLLLGCIRRRLIAHPELRRRAVLKNACPRLMAGLESRIREAPGELNDLDLDELIANL